MTEGATEKQERRLERRWDIELPVVVVWGMEKYQGTMRNLSERGMYITVEQAAVELQAEDRVEVLLEELDMTLEATVCRMDIAEHKGEPVGMGVMLNDTIDVRPICDRYL